MAGQPRLLFPGATPARKDWGMLVRQSFGWTTRVVAGTFSNSPVRSSHRPFPPSRHFDPFGTEFSV